MRTNAWITLFWSLGAASLACDTDRPIVVVTTPDAAEPSTPGAAGTTGTLDGGGAAGTTGVAGTGGIVPQGCSEMDQIVQEHSCTLTGACHDATGSAANFSLVGRPFTDLLGWKRQLVGIFPIGGGNSACGGANMPYLVAGSSPANGLLLNKLRSKNPVCGDQMPALPPLLTASEIDCVQRWANAVVATPSSGPCLDTTCFGECVGTCDGNWVCDETASCSAVTTFYCGCDRKTFVGNSCPQLRYARKGPC